MKRSAMLAMAMMLAAVAVLSSGCGVNPVTGEQELQLISYSQAGDAVKSAVPQVEQQFGGAINNPTLVSYVNSVGMKLVAQLPQTLSKDMGGYSPQWSFTPVNSDDINAFALADGHIYVTKGILKMMTNERELAAVLGHEITHVAAGHTRRQMQENTALQVLAEAAGAGGGSAAGAVAKLAGQLASLSFSRSDESEADKYGMKWMTAAGYNPWGMVDLQQKLLDAGGGGTPEILSTHPSGPTRISDAKDVLKSTYSAWQSGSGDTGEAAYRRATTGL
ncbi:MAG: Beta-barrel assembly-enhancing protease [Phycisphaerae bacterium]|nr:Beta-barrel assembly-enhancing protease [Phycisphaerae bacterium]